MNTQPGMVFRLPFYQLIAQAGRPAPKFAIVARVDPELLMFLICTDLARFIRHDPRRRRAYVQIPAGENHSFLKYDSWIDCSDAKDEYTAAALEAAYDRDPDCLVGEVALDVLQRMLGAVQTGATLARSRKRSIAAALGKRINQRQATDV